MSRRKHGNGRRFTSKQNDIKTVRFLGEQWAVLAEDGVKRRLNLRCLTGRFEGQLLTGVPRHALEEYAEYPGDDFSISTLWGYG